MSASKLVLIDGHSLAFRAFHALPLTLTAPDGELTNAVFGFTSMLLNVLRDQQPEYVAVAFDVGKTFRHEMFPEYKGHRERMPDELRTQVERIKQVVETLNIPIFTADGFEADDVLATLARQASAQGVETLIVTGDRDILQVVDDRVHVLTSGRQFSDTIIYDPAAVQEKYGLRPEQLVDFKALVGDKSDNIPGVRGIGEKTAAELLQKYGTLDNIYAHLEEIKPERVRKALEAGRADAELSRKLGRIATDVPLQLDLRACRTREYDRAKAIALFQDLAFRSLAEKLPVPSVVREAEPVPAAAAAEPATAAPEGGDQLALFAAESVEALAPPPPAEAGAMLVVTPTALAEVAGQLAAAPMIAFDTETTGLDPQQAELVGLAVAWGRRADQAAYIPLRHADTLGLPWEEVRQALQPAFVATDKTKVAHNAGYDLSILCLLYTS
ncbi:MAG: DNA polymerase I, partial [Anaerolineae bacterium]|nr:DNA polymerase I [Anaerolineae bacterium]